MHTVHTKPGIHRKTLNYRLVSLKLVYHFLYFKIGLLPFLSKLLCLAVRDHRLREWYKVGRAMGMERSLLNDIEVRMKSSDVASKKLFEFWLSRTDGTGDQPRRWTTIVTALEKNGLYSLANCSEIEDLARNEKKALEGIQQC